jgi:glycosyltransferase involved in cell wall biosynthesis
VIRTVVWMNIPSHHQSGFFEALRRANVDLVVRYYDAPLLAKRAADGWQTPQMQHDEVMVEPTLGALETISDWRSRVHVVPGYGIRFLRQLSAHLSRESVEWVHWSECSHPGIRRWFGYLRKRTYAQQVTRLSLGAFAQGRMAMDDFRRWGIASEKVAFLPYTTVCADPIPKPDPDLCADLKGRHAFVFIGTQCQRKGVDVMLKAFASIDPHERNRWAILIVGKDLGDGRYVEFARRLGLADDVIFKPPVLSERIKAVMKSGDVLILPSRFDGWGVVLNEAASAGLALIGSARAGASHHLIEPGINGFRVRGGSIESLKSAMLAYIRNPNLAIKHGKASLKIAAEHSPDRNAERFISAIESWRAMRGIIKKK